MLDLLAFIIVAPIALFLLLAFAQWVGDTLLGIVKAFLVDVPLSIVMVPLLPVLMLVILVWGTVNSIKARRTKARRLRLKPDYGPYAEHQLSCTCARCSLLQLSWIGELSRELEEGHKVGRGKGRIQVPTGGKLKSEALKSAGRQLS